MKKENNDRVVVLLEKRNNKFMCEIEIFKEVVNIEDDMILHKGANIL